MTRRDMTLPSEDEKEAFLTRLANGMSIVEAANRDESMRRKLYRARTVDGSPDSELTEFGRAWDERIKVDRRDFLVDVAQSRAVDGWLEPVFHKGEQVGSVRKYDHTLLAMLVKQADTSFRDNHKVEVTGPNDGPVQVEHRGVKLTDVLTVAREAGVQPGD